MPVMDGIECLSEIVNIPIIRDIPVVVLSSDTSKIELLSKMGVKAFIEKPVDCRLLQRLVQQVLGMNFTSGRNPMDQDFQGILSFTN
jgi:CheY-like chemotaxis protein